VDPFNGQLTGSGGLSKWTYNGWYPSGVCLTVPSHLAQTFPDDVSSAANTAATRSNPGREGKANFIREIYELKDFTHIMHNAGDLLNWINRIRKTPSRVRLATNLLKGVEYGSGAYLSNEFAISPLVDDVNAMIDFHNAADRRKADWEKLLKTGVLRKQVPLWKLTDVAPETTVTIESAASKAINAVLWKRTFSERWASVTWEVDPIWAQQLASRWHGADLAAAHLARQCIAGIGNPDQSIYKAMPWTWFTDWGANITNLFGWSSLSYPIRVRSICVMTHRQTEQVYTIDSQTRKLLNVNTCAIDYETKNRDVVTAPTLTAHLPFLDGWRTSILTSLNLTRARRHAGI
jgi:hypothetical protein